MKLTIEHICASYRKRQVLQDVSFTAPAGALTALIGGNGAGKSTLLHCILNQKADYQGDIRLDGRSIRGLSPAQRAAMIACLPQTLPRPRVTVEELVCFGRTPYIPALGRPTEADRAAADRAIRAVGMEEFRNAFVDTLSGGERKKAFFAMTLAQDTPLVLLDEPAAHLDTVSRFALLDRISRLCRETGKTFLVVMHELPEVLRYADRVVVLRSGRVVFDGTPQQCLEQQIPQTCFGIRLTGDRKNGYAAVPIIQK